MMNCANCGHPEKWHDSRGSKFCFSPKCDCLGFTRVLPRQHWLERILWRIGIRITYGH